MITHFINQGHSHLILLVSMKTWCCVLIKNHHGDENGYLSCCCHRTCSCYLYVSSKRPLLDKQQLMKKLSSILAQISTYLWGPIQAKVPLKRHRSSTHAEIQYRALYWNLERKKFINAFSYLYEYLSNAMLLLLKSHLKYDCLCEKLETIRKQVMNDILKLDFLFST